MSSPVDSLPRHASEIARHAEILEAMTVAAEECSAAGRHDAACAIVQTAAGVVALRHPGRFADERLEAVLAAASATLPSLPHAGGGGVLHVFTHALDIGGHTRLAWRWMERDLGRPHSFVVTRRTGAPPAPLVEAARATGGRELVVPGADAGLLATASALRALGGRFDEIVLHVNPNDPLPSLAWAGVEDRPPILLSDHADHCFWLGRDCADIVIGHRPVAAEITVERRGVPSERTATLALPLADVEATTPDRRAAARERIGVPPEARLLLTIGAPYKYEGGERHLLDAIEPLVANDPATILLVVGPSSTGRWAEASARTGGRVVATGPVTDVSDALASADVFVEAYPCSSGTAAVEAAQAGLPVVAWAPDPVEASLLGSAGAAADLWPVAGDAETLRADVEAACVDLDALLDHHSPDRWRMGLEAIRERVARLGPVHRDALSSPTSGVDGKDRILHELHARTGHCHQLGLVEAWVAHARAIAAWPAVEACFVPGLTATSTHLQLAERLDAAVAYPGPGQEAAAIEALRTILVGQLAERGVVAVDPGRLDEALPALEEALAAGADVDLDVTPTATPRDLVHDDVLVVRTPGDGLDGAAGVHVDATTL